jgi:hypothetical protein
MWRFGGVKQKRQCPGRGGLALVAALLVCLFFGSTVCAKDRPQKIFSSPEEAVKTMVEAVKAEKVRWLLYLFGPGSKALILSGDPVQDKEGREQFIKNYQEKNRLEANLDKAVLYIGKEEWPFPIPLVKTEKGWRFDTQAGRQEILARRIGRNELSAIQVCLAYLDAQKEFALRQGGPGKGLPEYAQRLISTPGRHDALYWETREGQEPSPLGPLFAAAQDAGTGENPETAPAPYHGYHYRILKSQGGNAEGGARDYVIEGRMIGGFALIAYPARYGASGVMTFIVNQDGIVFQKDLGKKTKEEVRTLMIFDPDTTWTAVRQNPPGGP